MDQITHRIGGKAFVGESDRFGIVTNPATGEVTAHVPFANAADINAAVVTARDAFPGWRDTSLARRTQVLFSFREIVTERRGELAAIITSEHGKVLSDAAGEIGRGLEVVELACGITHLLKGGYSASVSTGVDAFSLRAPLGVAAIVSPFNFPAMVPMWFFPIAIACGNAVILKPSEKDPSAANWIADRWHEAGLPDGIFNVLHGDQVAVEGLIAHPDVKSISFVGSTPVARAVYEGAAKAGKRAQALGGAKNHMVVLPDADLDLAADAAVSAGYGSAGERCMAISVVVAVGESADPLIAKIVERIGELKMGDGREAVDLGPLVTQTHRDKVAHYIEIGADEGATLVVDGRTLVPKELAAGYFLGATLFDDVTTEMTIYRDEIFGPVLSVVRVDSLDDALNVINANPYGNGTALFTTDGGAARRFQTEVEVGMVGINVAIPVPVAVYPFGGWKQSLFGDTHAYGTDGVHFFTRTKAITSRWLEPVDRGVDLGFPGTK
jgi:malonate-semialdehyde dehydrogenase (acetylating)/methylmalonate-semialdehyde dehydrogenase